MCAIESAAKANPNAIVKVYSFTAKLNKKTNEMLKIYPNLRMIKFEPEVVFKNTPLLKWWLNGTVLTSPYSNAHIADAFRIAVMWKYGGVYSDLDTITLKSFEPLINEGKNGIGDMFEDFASIGSGVMIFQPKLPYIRYLMEEFTRNYVADKWSINGPQLLAKTLLDYCDIDNIHRHLMPRYINLQEKTFNMTRLKKQYQTLVYLDKNHKCNNLSIFPQHYFYPILHVNTLLLNGVFAMKSTLNENYWKAIKSSYSIHFYNMLTFMLNTKPSDKSFYAELASIYCNFTYNYVKENDLYFDSK